MITVNQKIGTRRVSFTPSFYKRAYEQWKTGTHKDLIAMMREAETDSMVIGALQGRKAGFMRDLNFRPFSDDDSDQERADFIKEVFSRLKTRRLFKAIMQARQYKYSVIDFSWEVIDGRQVPVSFKAFEQKYFRYDPDDDELKIDFGNELRELPPETLLCESDEVPFMLPVLRDFILKEFGLEAWAAFIETFGEGIIIGYYPPGSSDDVKTALDNAVNKIASSSRGTAPKGTDIEIKESSRTTGDHEKFKDAADKGISISILGHANAVQQSGGMQVGQNDAPFKVSQNIANDDLFFIDECIDQLVQTIVDRNFADGRYPSAVTGKPDPLGVKERRENIRLAWDHGILINPNEYRKLGIEVYEDQEPVHKTDPFNFNN